MSDIRALFERLPLGWCAASYDGRRYGVTRQVGQDGRTQKVLAEELGGTDLVSANLYLVDGEPRLRPCEMPEQKVLAFLAGVEPDR